VGGMKVEVEAKEEKFSEGLETGNLAKKTKKENQLKKNIDDKESNL
jgi:hypothetical protein